MAQDALPVEHLFTLRADTAPPALIKDGPRGTRVVVAVTGGTFEGPRLRGTVVAPGGDWVTVRADRSARLDVRLLLQTGDGATILMTYSGIAVPGEQGTVLRSAPQFETGDARYAWLNNVQAVGLGRSGQGTVEYDIYALL